MIQAIVEQSDARLCPTFTAIKHRIINDTGLHYYSDRDHELTKSIRGRMESLGIDSFDAYLALLNDNNYGAQEFDELTTDLTIGETHFFRHPEMFEALRTTVLPDVIDRRGSTRELRIWSAGCSIGAEPYSIAMLLDRYFKSDLTDWQVDIVGTDINRKCLATAQRGLFTRWTLRGVDHEALSHGFFESQGGWQVKPHLQQRVRFLYHNLAKHPYPSLIHDLISCDLILCRNVLIYFSPAMTEKVATKFYDCLTDGGWLAVGHTEPHIDRFRQYETINQPGAILYRRPGVATLNEREASKINVFNTPLKSDQLVLKPDPHWQSFELEQNLPEPIPIHRSVERQIVEELAVSPIDEARALADSGQVEAAADRCKQIIDEDRLNASAHFLYALLLDAIGEFHEAESALKRTLYLDRNHAAAHYHLGLMQLRAANAPASSRSFRNTLDLLEQRGGEEPVMDSEGLNVAELRDLAETNLNMAAA